MDFDLLRLAVALIDDGDLAAAGKRLSIGRRQAAARVAQLERRVGAILFDHSGGTVRLTPAGEAFIGEARLSLAAAERAGRLALAVAGRPHRIDIGVNATALIGPVRDLVEDPAWGEAGLSPVLHEMRGEEQLAGLADGRLVMGFLTPPFAAPPRLQHRVIAGLNWVAAVPAQDAHLRRSASLAALARKPLIMIAREQAPLVHDGLLGAFRATGTEPQIAQQGHQWTSILAMVALGLGSTLVPKLVAKRITVDGAVILPLADGTELPPWPIALAHMPQPTGSRASDAIKLAIQRFSQNNG